LLRRSPALLGASLGTLNNAFYVSIGHTQLFPMGLIPVALLLSAAFLRTANGPARNRRLAGSGLAILLPLMLYTRYYVTLFLVFSGALATIILLLVDLLSRSGAGSVAVRTLVSRPCVGDAYLPVTRTYCSHTVSPHISSDSARDRWQTI